MKRSVILDFDQSVGAVQSAQVIDLREQRDAIRFGCGMRRMRELRVQLDSQLPPDYGTVFLGSGDFHHVSWPLIERLAPRGPFQVVVLDNHPDNMRFPFGVHCGSWVRRVALLPFVSHVHVLGITSPDISRASIWENYLEPLRCGKLSYWCTDVDTRWTRSALGRALNLDRAFRRFDSIADMVSCFGDEIHRASQDTYLSIDKDVLSSEVAHTNWDQGRMREDEMMAIIDLLAGRIIGSDITGDVSIHRYRQWWKRKLSALDAQPDIAPNEISEWQAQQHALNVRLLERITQASGI
ncbi:MAG: hypothetical protein ABI451_00805 [Dokdonella sp.]